MSGRTSKLIRRFCMVRWGQRQGPGHVDAVKSSYLRLARPQREGARQEMVAYLNEKLASKVISGVPTHRRKPWK